MIDLTGDDPPEPTRRHHLHILPQPRPPLRRSNVSIEPEDLDDIIILRTLRHRPHNNSATNNNSNHNARPPPRDFARLRQGFLPNIGSLMDFFSAAEPYAPPPDLNYQRPAFGHPPPPPPPPPHARHAGMEKVEVAPAREGFSRDTGEETVVVCPACGGELEYDPAKNEGAKKRKREKGEHHFWAVKACGHVCFFWLFFFYLLTPKPSFQFFIPTSLRSFSPSPLFHAFFHCVLLSLGHIQEFFR